MGPNEMQAHDSKSHDTIVINTRMSELVFTEKESSLLLSKLTSGSC